MRTKQKPPIQQNIDALLEASRGAIDGGAMTFEKVVARARKRRGVWPADLRPPKWYAFLDYGRTPCAALGCKSVPAPLSDDDWAVIERVRNEAKGEEGQEAYWRVRGQKGLADSSKRDAQRLRNNLTALLHPGTPTPSEDGASNAEASKAFHPVPPRGFPARDWLGLSGIEVDVDYSILSGFAGLLAVALGWIILGSLIGWGSDGKAPLVFLPPFALWPIVTLGLIFTKRARKRYRESRDFWDAHRDTLAMNDGVHPVDGELAREAVAEEILAAREEIIGEGSPLRAVQQALALRIKALRANGEQVRHRLATSTDEGRNGVLQALSARVEDCLTRHRATKERVDGDVARVEAFFAESDRLLRRFDERVEDMRLAEEIAVHEAAAEAEATQAEHAAAEALDALGRRVLALRERMNAVLSRVVAERFAAAATSDDAALPLLEQTLDAAVDLLPSPPAAP